MLKGVSFGRFSERIISRYLGKPNDKYYRAMMSSSTRVHLCYWAGLLELLLRAERTDFILGFRHARRPGYVEHFA